MSKKDDQGKIKMVLIEMEGNNQTLQQGIKTIADTLSDKRVNIIQVESREVIDNLLEEADIVEDIAENTEKNVEVKSSIKKNSKRTYSTPEILELDLKAGDPNFEDFVKLKNPTSNSKKYLIVAYWLKEKLEIKEISKDHIYTCFKYMKWSVPKDTLQTFRNLKSKYAAFNGGESNGFYAINHVGENLVTEMNDTSI